MPFSSDFLSQVMPAAQAYQQGNGLVLPSSMQPAAPAPVPYVDVPVPAGPPPPPPATVPAAAPPPAQTAAPVPETPAQPQNIMVRGAGTPAHEVMTKGATGIHYLNEAEKERLKGVADSTELQNKAMLQKAMAASVAEEEAKARSEAAHTAMLEDQRRLNEANQFVTAASEEAKNVAPITGYWEDRGVGAQIGNALAMAVAGFGQAISGQGGPNPVMAMLQANMDQDLKVKQMNFQRQKGIADDKKNAAQQYYDNLAKQVGIEGANQLYSAAQKDAAAAHAEQIAAGSGIQENMARAAELSAKYRADADKEREGAVKLIQGTKGETSYIVPELGNAKLSQKEYNDYQVKKALQGNELNARADAAAAKGTKGGSEGTRFIAEKMQSANIPGTLAAIDAASEEFKKGNESGVGIAGRIVKALPLGEKAYEVGFGKDASQREQDWSMLKSQIMNSLTGAGMSNEERERYDAMLNGSGTPEARQHAIGRAREALKRKEASILAGAGPEAAAEYLQTLNAIMPRGAAVNPTTGIKEKPVK